MKILIAADSFKGCLSSLDAGKAIAEGIRRAHAAVCPVEPLDLKVRPMADGGEGTAYALGIESHAETILTTAMNPVGTPIEAEFYYAADSSTAYIDVAAASGLALLKPEEVNAKRTSTSGTGQLISAAVQRGAKRIFLCLGGSATVDLGVGALQALGVEFYDETGGLIDRHLTGGELGGIASIRIPEETRLRMSGIAFRLLSDVETPLVGHPGAAEVFGPQKGLSSDEIGDFSHQLERVGMILKGDRAFLESPGSGAAGGVGVGLSALAPVTFLPGASTVIEATGIDKELEGCDLAVTGEGRSDSQTLLRKAPFGLMLTAKERGVPTLLLSGDIRGRQTLLDAGFLDAVNINETPMKPGFSEGRTTENPLDPAVAARRLADAAERAVGGFLKDLLREKPK